MLGRSESVRTPVRREKAQTYILVSLVSFAGTVVLTRLFLEITGYPQIGSGELHIAHVLWGGLILFVATLFPLIFANQWALSVSAMLSGIGIGLFIDEVGKFITRDNNYFYPPAAPIIYAFFLLTVLVYIRLRRPHVHDSRQELYQILDGLSEVLDHDLDPNERAALEKRLIHVSESPDHPNLAYLAQSLLTFTRAEALKTIEPKQGLLARVQTTAKRWETAILSRQVVRTGLIVALLFVGAFAWYEIVIFVLAGLGQGRFIESVLITGIQRGEIRSSPGASWFLVHLFFQWLVGLFALISSFLLVVRRERRAIEFGTACMVLSLTAVNLLAFFVDQFSTAAIAVFQLGVSAGFSLLQAQVYWHELTLAVRSRAEAQPIYCDAKRDRNV